MSKQELMYDKRIVDRLIKSGVLSQAEYDEYLAKLPDVADKSEPLVPEELEGEGEAAAARAEQTETPSA